MDTERFPVESQVDMATWMEVRVCSYCLLGLIQLCHTTTMPKYIVQKKFSASDACFTFTIMDGKVGVKK